MLAYVYIYAMSKLHFQPEMPLKNIFKNVF